MIAIKRAPRPAALARNAKNWRKALRSAKTHREREKALGKYRHSDIKNTLVTTHYGKCAYCESQIRHVDYGHIEHYLPKLGARGRPDLTFTWKNLLLGCGVCNGAEWKGEKAPTPAEGGPFVNPCNDNPDLHFRFEYDPLTKLASVRGTSIRGVTTEIELGLNRKELRVYRSRQVTRLVALAKYAATDADARALIAEAKQADGEYAAFARSLL